MNALQVHIPPRTPNIGVSSTNQRIANPKLHAPSIQRLLLALQSVRVIFGISLRWYPSNIFQEERHERRHECGATLEASTDTPLPRV